MSRRLDDSTKALIRELPDNVTVANSLEGEFDVIQFFVTKRKKLEDELSRLSNALRSRGLVWVTYPKGNQLDTDINRDSIVAYAKTIGLKAVAQVSVDDIWSALRFKVVLDNLDSISTHCGSVFAMFQTNARIGGECFWTSDALKQPRSTHDPR